MSAIPIELKSAINKNQVRAVALAANSRSSARLLLRRRFFLVCRLHILMVSAFPLAAFTQRFIDRTFRSSSLQARKSYVFISRLSAKSWGSEGRIPPPGRLRCSYPLAFCPERRFSSSWARPPAAFTSSSAFSMTRVSSSQPIYRVTGTRGSRMRQAKSHASHSALGIVEGSLLRACLLRHVSPL